MLFVCLSSSEFCFSWKRNDFVLRPRRIATDCDDRLHVRGGTNSSSRRPCLRPNGSATLGISTRTAQNIALVVSKEPTIWGVAAKKTPKISKLQDDGWRSYEAEAIRWTNTSNFEIFPGGVSPISPGCVDLRPIMDGFCQNDGRYSIAERNGTAWLYMRANANPQGGGRHVSVAQLLLPRNETVATTHRLKWGRFHLLTFLPPPPWTAVPGHRRSGEKDHIFAKILSQPRLAIARADIYTAAINDYRGVFLGLFSTTVLVKPKEANQSAVHRAAILVAVSCDAQNFSAPLPVVRGLACGHGEMNDHAVDGFVGTTGPLSDPLYFYVHHGVPGTFAKVSDGCPFWEEEISTVHRLPKSHVVRYGFKRLPLHLYIRAAVAQLHRAGRCSNSPDVMRLWKI